MPTFVASDGTEFDNRKVAGSFDAAASHCKHTGHPYKPCSPLLPPLDQEWRKYEFELSFTFRKQKGTPDKLLELRKDPGHIDGQVRV